MARAASRSDAGGVQGKALSRSGSVRIQAQPSENSGDARQGQVMQNGTMPAGRGGGASSVGAGGFNPASEHQQPMAGPYPINRGAKTVDKTTVC